MVSHRDGSEINLLDSSIRTTGGALFSTTVYALSGIVYHLSLERTFLLQLVLRSCYDQ